jgi:hypothetical protein
MKLSILIAALFLGSVNFQQTGNAKVSKVNGLDPLGGNQIQMKLKKRSRVGYVLRKNPVCKIGSIWSRCEGGWLATSLPSNKP